MKSFNRSFTLSAICLGIVACGGEHEDKLDGLWHMQHQELDQISILGRPASLGFDISASFLLSEQGNTVQLVMCGMPNNGISLNYSEDTLGDESEGITFKIIDKSNLALSSAPSVVVAKKADNSTEFNMGEVTLISNQFPNGSETTNEVCSGNMDVNYSLGEARASIGNVQLVSAIFQGEPLYIAMKFDGDAGQYEIGDSFTDDNSWIMLFSPQLVDEFGASTVILDSGTLTVTEFDQSHFSGTVQGTYTENFTLSFTFDVNIPKM